MNNQKIMDVFEQCQPVPWSGCWLWDRGCTSSGYAVGRPAGSPRQVYIHRYVATIVYGSSAMQGKHVLHSCDVPTCVNPDHLSLGTNNDNIADRDAKGRNYWRNKTHCKHGHEYTEANTMRVKCRSGTQRICRQCHNNKSRERYARLRGVAK